MLPDNTPDHPDSRYSDPPQENAERPSVSNWHGLVVTYTYDMPEERPAKKRFPSFVEPVDWIVNYTYDDSGKQITQKDK